MPIFRNIDTGEEKFIRSDRNWLGVPVNRMTVAELAAYGRDAQGNITDARFPQGIEEVAPATQTYAEVKAGLLIDIKQIRKSALDRIVAGAGICTVYEVNRRAAECVDSGAGSTVMFGSVTATDIATDSGAKLGLTAAQWATYILGENEREGQRAKKIEEYYLHYYYTLASAEADNAIIQGYVDTYQAKCNDLLAATTTGEILLL